MKQNAFIIAACFALSTGALRCASETLEVPAEQSVSQEVFQQAVKYITTGRLAMLQLLLKEFNKLAFADFNGVTLLHFAVCRQANPKFMQELLDRGANIEARNKRGETPLFRVATSGFRFIRKRQVLCEQLLRNGADPDAKELCGATVLQRAAAKGRMKACELLLSYGADIDNVCNFGRTALTVCVCRRNHPETARLLIQWFPNMQQLNDYDKRELTEFVPDWHQIKPRILLAIKEFLVDRADLPADLMRLITHEFLGPQYAS